MPRSADLARRWGRLLAAEPALTCVISSLSPPESVCLLVYALEAQYDPLVRFIYAHPHLLSLGDASRRFASVLHCAASYGHAEVVQRLLRFRLSHISLLGDAKKPSRRESYAPSNPTKRAKRLAWVTRNTPYEFPADVMYEAARQGDQEVLEWLHCCCNYEPHRAMEYAASAGKLEVVTWLFGQQQDQENQQAGVLMVQDVETSLQVVNWVTMFPKRKCFREVFASRAGFLADIYDQRDPLLPWDNMDALRTSLGRRRYRAIDTAAAQGDLNMVRKLHEDGRWPCSSVAMDTAAANGHLEVVKFLHENRREGGTAVGMCSAAGNGHLDVVMWLYENRRNDGCRSLVLDLAATNGHVEVLRWLVPRFPRFSCSPAFLSSVAAHGHIETLRYLHKEMGMALDLRTLEAAIGSGHVELVEYIADRLPAEVKHTMSPAVADKAAGSGNLELLALVVDRFGLWSPQMLGAAALTGSVAVAEWIVKRSDARPTETQKKPTRERRDRAATSNSIEFLSTRVSAVSVERRRSSVDNMPAGTIRPLDVVNGTTLYRCASLGHFDIVEWLLQRGLASPSFALSAKERELVLRSVVGRGVLTTESVDAIALFGEGGGEKNSTPMGLTEVSTAAVSTATSMVITAATGSEGGFGGTLTAGGRGSASEKRPGFDSYAWALPGKTSVGWQRRFVRLAVQYDPESALPLEWVPLWAAQRGELYVLKQIATVKHPHLFTPQTFKGIMRYTKCGDALQWFQTRCPTNMGDASIVEWGVKYRQFGYLSYVFLEFQPTERLQMHGVEYALQVACALGHMDVVTWICGNCEIFLKVPAAELHSKLGQVNIWKGALVAAARYGQTKVLNWLHEKFTFFQKVPDSPRKMTLVGAMADAAAGYGQRCVLRWLQVIVGPQMKIIGPQLNSKGVETTRTEVQTSFVSTDGLLQAMTNRHVDVVQWICAADINLVAKQTPERRAELATFLREEADGFVSSRLGFAFPPM